LHGKELIDVQTTLCRPFAKFPIQGFQELTICPTSFTGVDLLHLSKAVTLMGMLSTCVFMACIYADNIQVQPTMKH
jgi:hypothetical protein